MKLYPIEQIDFEIGTIIKSSGSPGSGWVDCDGSEYLKSSYVEYVANAYDLHPKRFQESKKIFFTNSGSAQIKSVAINGQYAVMVGNTRAHWYSDDYGETWTEYSTNLPASGDYRIVRFADGRFVTAAYGSTQLAYSTDGISWSSVTLSASGNWENLVWNGALWILCPLAGGTYFTSSNGSSWTQRSSLPSLGLAGLGIDPVNNNWMTVDGTDQVYHSTDGINWTSKMDIATLGIPYWFEGHFSNPMYFADSDRWILLTSSYQFEYGGVIESYDNGATWDAIPLQYKITPPFFHEYQYGAIWDGDCWVNLQSYSATYSYGMYLKDNVKVNLFTFPAEDTGGIDRISLYDVEYENMMLIITYGSGESAYDWLIKSSYTPYDCSTYFSVPYLKTEANGMKNYIRIQ